MKDVVEVFGRDIAQHELQILRDDGLYRHLRCSRPETYCFGFDIVTWPGYLAYVGDMGSYVFSRVEDMFTFFGGDTTRSIDYRYWAEKIQGGGVRPAEQFSDTAFAAAVKEWREQQCERLREDFLTGIGEHFSPMLGLGCWWERGQLCWGIGPDESEIVPMSDLAKIDEFRDEVDWQILRREVYSEESAYAVLDRFEWRYQASWRREDVVRIREAWDTLGSFREFEFRFVWCCHALVWAIDQYRAATREALAA